MELKPLATLTDLFGSSEQLMNLYKLGDQTILVKYDKGSQITVSLADIAESPVDNVTDELEGHRSQFEKQFNVKITTASYMGLMKQVRDILDKESPFGKFDGVYTSKVNA